MHPFSFQNHQHPLGKSAFSKRWKNYTAESLSVAVGGALNAGVLPTIAFMETVAGNAIIQGATQAAWWQRQTEDTTWRFLSNVRMGLTAGETNAQIVKRVRDTLEVSRRNAEALVRTSVMTVANDTRERVFSDHEDIMADKEWVATLDMRTCPACAARDNKRWKTDGTAIGHSIPYRTPPIHFGDRCAIVPVLKTWKELGIDLAEFPESTRASMDGQVEDPSFEAFLARKGEKWQDEVLGKGRADLWRRKVISFDQMIGGDGNPLTLEQLKAKYGTGVDSAILKPMKNDSYEIAKGGGRHHGFFEQWSEQKKGKIEKSIKSLVDQVDSHNEKIANPSKYIDRPISNHELSYLVSTYWPKEIRNFKQQINILEGILGEIHHVKK